MVARRRTGRARTVITRREHPDGASAAPPGPTTVRWTAAADRPPDEQIELRTVDGVRLDADIYRPDGDVRGAVVLVHPFTASRRAVGVLRQARYLVERGFGVLAYDGRGHGTSSGRSTIGRTEAHDLEAVVGHVRQYGHPIVPVGASMGSLVVLHYAVQDDGLAGVVLVSTPVFPRTLLTPRGVGAALLVRTAPGRRLARSRFGVRLARWEPDVPPVELVRDVQVPVAVVQGLADPTVRPGGAPILYEAAPEPRRLQMVDGMGHAFEPGGLVAITDAIDWVLGLGGGPSTTATARGSGAV